MGSEPLWVGFQTQTFPTVPPAISPSVARVAVCQPRLSLRPASLELRGVGDIRKTTPEGGNSRISHGVGGGGPVNPAPTHSMNTHLPCVGPTLGVQSHMRETQTCPAPRSSLPSQERRRLSHNCSVSKGQEKPRKLHHILLPTAASLRILFVSSLHLSPTQAVSMVVSLLLHH